MTVTAFFKNELFAQGSEAEVAARMRAALPLERASDLLAFDDETGRQLDLDLREGAAPRGRGRPSLGVEPKEVTLLPRHWEWLAQQRGGASATLRQLVEEALRKGRSARARYDAACRFLGVMAGDLPAYEEAVREIYLGNVDGYDRHSRDWPQAIRDHARALAFSE